jgi:hypothetical protein
VSYCIWAENKRRRKIHATTYNGMANAKGEKCSEGAVGSYFVRRRKKV